MRALPKIDLHRHLEGAIRPATLADICRSRHVPLPTYDPDELTDILCVKRRSENLEGFLLPFKTIKFAFTDREAIARIAYECVEDAHLDGIEYAEFRFSPEYMSFYHKLAMADVLEGIAEGFALAERHFPTRARMIVSICRHCTSEILGFPWPTPDEVVQVALDYRDRGVVGFDLSGVEAGFPPEPFARQFEQAREAGLGITVHAGEDAGPESVRGAIEALGATRIGHGVRIVQDPEVVRLVIDRGVTLEVCPTSNVQTHAVESLEAHPIRELFDMGVKVTVNSDDPTVCGVTLSEEYELICEHFGFTPTEVERLIRNAREAAFGI